MQEDWLISFLTCSTAIMERGVEVERVKAEAGRRGGAWKGGGGRGGGEPV